ncbi:single-strand DNA-binding protein [Sulfobacillus thermosulfidooxidans DSM 9293]|uniref:Single-stranded DNA-binding protein n=2 Tax=Sulfobacillus thermosulfidooxidans TaxID=28034 RepID=A0A1W1W723_SULTA|nr:single-stranded DNA-binding protein [Sulfobacillus thermosulfidooxidans]SMC02002.1 single-strand DNA-binding protein [Sulfobacillus thermosulfidooxidans DSM 9293]
MFNKIILIGRLTRDPELRYTPQGVPVASFTLAVDRPFTNAQGQRDADFVDCVAWRKLGETVGNHLTKGRLVAVEGRLQIRGYTAQDGNKRRVAEVIIDTLRFLDAPKSSPSSVAAHNHEVTIPPDDVPF